MSWSSAASMKSSSLTEPPGWITALDAGVGGLEHLVDAADGYLLDA
jgi:hypothetical protein